MAKIKEKDTTDKWKFWLAFKPFLSDKVKSKEPFILVNNVNIASNGIEVAKTFNDFSQIVSKILKFWSISVRTTYTVDYQVIQSHKHLHYLALFSAFSKLLLQLLRKLNVNKVIQDTDIPAKALKVNE